MQNSTLVLNPVDATAPIKTVSDRYGFVNSREVMSHFEAAGWVVESQNFARVKDSNRAGFQKHLVWMRNDSLPKIAGLTSENESAVRLALVNSHDMTTRFNLFLGVMRAACLNQILTGGIFKYFSAVHSKAITQKLDAGIDFVVSGIPELVEKIKFLSSVELNDTQKTQLVNTVIPMRFANVKGFIGADISSVDKIVRTADDKNDAYTVLNRIQEKLVRGGINYGYMRNVKNETGEIVGQELAHTTTRQVGAISTQIKLNEKLFSETLKLVGVSVDNAA